MSVSQTHIGSTKQVVALPFHFWNIPDANGTLYTQVNTNGTLDEYTMPYAGSIIGVTGSLNAALTSGSLQFQSRINGSLAPAFDSSARLDLSAQTFAYTQGAQRNNLTFTAGQRVGLNFNKTGTVAPVTTDGQFLLVVLLEGVQY